MTVSGPGAASNEYGLIFGKKGTGKTTYLRKMFARARARGRNTIFMDPTGKNADMGTVVKSGKAFWSHARAAVKTKTPYNLVVQIGWDESYDNFWRILYDLGDHLLALDEVHFMASATRIHRDLESLIRLGRNRFIDIITTTQTPPGLHNVLKANSDWVVAFGQKSHHYASVLNDTFFHMPNGAELMVKLPPFYYLRVDNAGNVTRGRVEL